MHNVFMELAQTMRYDRSATADLMATLHREFTFHGNFDEQHLHPLLRHALDQQARDEVGQLFMEAKEVIPGLINPVGVEPHPNLAIAMCTFCDRLRDRLGNRSPV